ncbi:MAG: hypothetical protein H0V01_11270 [Bacteroidetes bacterium]|nr:hypothetical protein [Bacteroidota bacterium]HET6243346.1 hypothetical protein [Bacteroidia bacterium]
MRVVDEIPHELFKITVFSWNAKYIIKFELDNFEQSYKISENDVSGIEELKNSVNETFLDEVFEHFLAMRKSFGKAIQLK